MVLGGISQFFPPSLSSVIVGVYVILFGLGMIAAHSAKSTNANTIAVVAGLEFLPNVPDYAYRYASFLFSFLGRGVCEFIFQL